MDFHFGDAITMQYSAIKRADYIGSKRVRQGLEKNHLLGKNKLALKCPTSE
jgi:hypothetical protein